MIRSDEHIKKDIVDNLFWNSSLDASDIKVAVTGGEVRLSGTVSNYAAQISAVSEAWSVDGVERIRNEIVVRRPDGGEPLMDREIESRAIRVLAWNPDLESSDQSIAAYISEVIHRNLKLDTKKLTIAVKEGRVVLSGQVPDKYAYQDVHNAARLTLGVRDVENNLKVAR